LLSSEMSLVLMVLLIWRTSIFGLLLKYFLRHRLRILEYLKVLLI
jgi:hypothetical protein